MPYFAIIEKTQPVKASVREPPEVHRELAMKAAEEGVSLIRLGSAKLSHS